MRYLTERRLSIIMKVNCRLKIYMELKGLKGREALAGYDVSSLIEYEGI